MKLEPVPFIGSTRVNTGFYDPCTGLMQVANGTGECRGREPNLRWAYREPGERLGRMWRTEASLVVELPRIAAAVCSGCRDGGQAQCGGVWVHALSAECLWCEFGVQCVAEMAVRPVWLPGHSFMARQLELADGASKRLPAWAFLGVVQGRSRTSALVGVTTRRSRCAVLKTVVRRLRHVSLCFGHVVGQALQDSRVRPRRHPHVRSAGAADRASRPAGLLAKRHGIQGFVGRACDGDRSPRSDGGDGL